jgi:hypothetical protein
MRPYNQITFLFSPHSSTFSVIDLLFSTMIRAYRFGSLTARRAHTSRRFLSSTPPPKQPASTPSPVGPAVSKTQGIGTGKGSPGSYIKDRGPVSWPSLFLVGIAAASIVAYYNIERERRLESAMGRVVSSESDGWSPNPDVMAPRKFKLTPWGWFPEDDAFGPCKSGTAPAHRDNITSLKSKKFYHPDSQGSMTEQLAVERRVLHGSMFLFFSGGFVSHIFPCLF